MPPKPRQGRQHSTTDGDSSVDTDLDSPVTYRGLDAALNKHLNKTIEALQSNLEATTAIANNALALVSKLEKELSALKEEHNKLKNHCQDNNSHVQLLEERIEDRTNRQLRKTLVFHNIPELSEQESWDQTGKLVAEAIADVCNIKVEEAADNLERVHRSAPNPRYKGKAPRKIYAAIYDWKFSEKCKAAFKDKNIAKTSTIFCEQMYGPLTRERRRLAMLERKRLKANNEITSAYIDFPAKLMAKTNKDGKYKCIKDFSNHKVRIGKRD